MNKDEFVEEIFEIAFGDDAINRGFEFEEVVTRIREYSDKAYEAEENED